MATLAFGNNREIKTRQQAENVLAALITEEEHAAYHCINLKVMTTAEKGEDGRKHIVTRTKVALDSVDWNCGSNGSLIYTVAKVRMGNAVKPVQRFSFSEVHLTVNSKGKLKGEDIRPAEWLYRATLAYDTVGCHWYAYSLREGRDLYYQLDGELAAVSVDKWNSIIKGEALIYNDCSTITGARSSAGNLKRNKLVCPCMSEAGVAHLEKSIKETGGISLLYTDPSRLNTAKAVAQANVREAAPYTANKRGPLVRVMAVFMGRWKLKDIVTGEAFDGCDGWFAANEAMFRRFLEANGYKVVSDEATVGIMSQDRPFAFKGVSTSMPGWFMADMALKEEGLCHGADVVIKKASEIDKAFQEEYRIGIESKGKEGKLAGKLVVVVYDDDIEIPENRKDFDLSLIDVMGDLNAQKAEQDLRRASHLNILKLFRKNESAWKNGMGTSTQLLQSLVPVCLSLKAIMGLGFRTQMARSVEDICREEARSVTSQDVLSSIKQARPMAADEAASMEISDAERSVISNNDYGMNVVNLAELLAPTYAWEKDAALFKDELKAAYKAGKSRADRVRVPIDGTDFVLTPDFAAFYGKAVLGLAEDGAYEVFSNLLNRLGVERGVGIKYPKQHIKELARLAAQKDSEIAGKLAGNENAAKIAYLYACVGEAAMLVTCTAYLMSQEAGMDFDGDEMFVTTVLTEEQRDARFNAIDWSDKVAAMEQYVKIQLAYYFGQVLSLVVSIDPDAEDKSAAKSSKKIKDVVSAGTAFESPKATVNHDKLWEGLKLGDNMPTRQDVEKWQPLNPGNEAAVRNILNANLEVGIVTVMHLIFSDLFFKLEGMKKKADAELNAEELKTVEVARLIMTEVFGNKEVVGQVYDGLKYVKEGKLEVVRMDINEYHRIRESAANMELTRANMMNFCYDLVANGRMAQEFTIDACKTLMKVANIDYAELLRKYVKVLSRGEMDINFKYGANDGDISVVAPNIGTAQKPEYYTDTKIVYDGNDLKRLVVRDWAQELKNEGYKAIVAAIKPLLMNKPAFDSEFIEELAKLATDYPEAAKLARDFQVKYKHLNTAQDAAILEAKQGISDPAEKKLVESDVKRNHAGFFNAIGHTIRKGLKSFRASLESKGLNADEVAALEAALLISLAYTSKKGNVDSKLSSFAYRVLPEEYMRFILTYACADDDRVARYTEDALEWVDHKLVKAGDTLSFRDGEGYLHGDVVAVAKDGLNGEYDILEEGGRLYASTDVLDLMPLQKESSTLVVETKLDDWNSSHLGSILKELAPEGNDARWVQLWGKKSWGQNGDDLHDVLAVEDEAGAFGIGYAHFGNDNALNDIYDGVRGQVTNVTVYTDKEDPSKRSVIILLENCESMFGTQYEKEYVEPVDESLPQDMGWNKPTHIIKAEKFTVVNADDGSSIAPVVVEKEEIVEAKPEVKAAAGFHSVEIEEQDEDLADEFDAMCYE